MGNPNNRIYPFDELMKRPKKALRIDSTDSKVRTAAHAYAKRHGFRITTSYTKSRTAIVIERVS